MSEDLHDLVAVEVRSHPLQVLLGGQLGDPFLEVVIVGLQPRRAALVAGGAVRAHQLVQPRQQGTCVGDVAPHRRVGPLPVAVAVEAQMQIHQLRHVVDHLLGVLQRPHPLAGHLGADHLVVMKAHPAVGFVPARRGLADVVQQRRPAQHQVGRPRPRGRSPAAAPSANAGRRPCADGVRRWPSASRRSRAAPHRRGRVPPSGRCPPPDPSRARACPTRRRPVRR